MDNMEHIKKLKIEGWTYNPNIEDKLGSIYFDRDDDNYLRISPLKNSSDTYVFTITQNCEDVVMLISVVPPNDDLALANITALIKKELQPYEN